MTDSYNLRSPGQYYDSEAGLFYNYFRDYNPATGRYVESDPIGLKGGINTYLYSDADPIAAFDRSGLDPTTFPLPPAENTTCCDTGQIAICMNNPRNKNYKCKIVQDAMVLHEMTHVNDFRRWAPFICAKFTGKQSVALGFTTYTEQIQSELSLGHSTHSATPLTGPRTPVVFRLSARRRLTSGSTTLPNQAIPSVLNQTYGR